MKRFLFYFLSIFILISFLCSSVPVSAAEIGSTSGSVSPIFQAAIDELTSNPTISPDDLLVSSFIDNRGFHFIFSSYSRLLSYSDDILYTGQSNGTIPYESITIDETSFSGFAYRWGGYSGLPHSGSLSLLSTYDFTYLYDENVIWSNNRFFAFDFKSFRVVEWNQWGWVDALNYYIGSYSVPVFDDSFSSSKMDIDVEGFINFFIYNDKNLNKLFDNVTFLNPSSDIIDYLVHYLDSYGGSYDSFFNHRIELEPILKSGDASSLTRKHTGALHEILMYQYQQFLKSKSLILPDRVPVSLDDDTLVTDLDDDSCDTLILREILRLNTLIYNVTNHGYYDFSRDLRQISLNTSDNNVNVLNYNQDEIIDSNNNMLFALNNIAGLAVMNNDLTANLNNALTDMSLTLNDISEDVNVNNDISDKLDTVNMSITNLSYNAGGSDGGSGGSSGSGVDAPSAPEFDFDTMREGMGSFFDFIAFVISKLPPVVFYLFSAGMAVVIYCRILGR